MQDLPGILPVNALNLHPGFLGPNAVMSRIGRLCPAETLQGILNLKGILAFGQGSFQKTLLVRAAFSRESARSCLGLRAVLSRNARGLV